MRSIPDDKMREIALDQALRYHWDGGMGRFNETNDGVLETSRKFAEFLING